MTDKSAREILREWSFVERCGHYPHTEVEKPCPHCDGTAQTILVALEAGGFVVVPKEPTEEMHNAARDWSAWKYGKPIGIDASDGCYKAMLAASNPKEEGSDN